MTRLFLLIAFCSPAYGATLTTDVDLNWGLTSMTIDTGGNSQNLESLSSVEINYNLLHPQSDFSIGFSFFELLSTNSGTLSMSRFSVGGLYYPLGLNLHRVIFDSGVEGRILRSTPFFGTYFGITNTSVDELNASAFDLSLKMGLEVPVSANTILVGQLSLLSSLPGETTAGVTYSYSGIIATVGLQLTGL